MPIHSSYMFGSADASHADTGAVAESARVVRSDRGVRINGYLVAADADGFGAWYTLMTDPQGQVRRLTVRADSPHGEITLSLTHAADSPWVVSRDDGSASESLRTTADDVILTRSSLSYALPLATRLPQLQRDGELEIDVVVVDIPSLQVSSTKLTYRKVETDPDGVTAVAVTVNDTEFSVLIDADGMPVSRSISLSSIT